MRIQQERMFSRCVKIHGLRYDAVNFHSVFAALPLLHACAAECVFIKPGVLIRDKLDRAEFQITPEDFCRVVRITPCAHRREPICADFCKIDHTRLFCKLPNRTCGDLCGEDFDGLPRVAAEIDRLAIRSPNRFAGVQLKRLGQFLCFASIGASYKQVGLVKGSGTADQIGDPLAVW